MYKVNHFKPIVCSVLVLLLLTSCGNKKKNEEHNKTGNENVEYLEEIKKFRSEVNDLEKVHEIFIKDFYNTLNKVNQVAKTEDDENRNSLSVFIPDVPVGYDKNISVPNSTDLDYEKWLDEAQNAFADLIKLNDELKDYVIDKEWKKDGGAKLRLIGENAGDLIQKHSQAFDEIEVQLDHEIDNGNSNTDENF